MPDAGTIHRVSYRYEAAGVDCWTRQHFVNLTAYPDNEFAIKAGNLLALIGDKFRSLLSIDTSVRDAVVSQPTRPNITPFAQGGNASGVRIGNSLPGMVYHQIHFWGQYSASEKAFRNTMKVSGISMVDARENHMLVNLELTKIAFCQFFKNNLMSAAGVNFQWRVVRRTPGGTPLQMQSAPVLGFTNPTALHVLKSRRQ